jgi:hypothetical protein
MALLCTVYSADEQAVDPPLRDACEEHALPAIFKCFKDYTTDNRGDVGSQYAIYKNANSQSFLISSYRGMVRMPCLV